MDEGVVKLIVFYVFLILAVLYCIIVIAKDCIISTPFSSHGGIIVNPKKNSWFLFFSGVALIFLVGLRGVDVGIDTPSYLRDVSGSASFDHSNYEFGYLFLLRVCVALHVNSTGFLLLCAIIARCFYGLFLP